MNEDMAVACRLTTPELAARLSELHSGLLAQVTTVTRLEHGIRLALPSSDAQVKDGLAFVQFERQCCPFLGFAVALQPDDPTFSIDITGPINAQTFIAETFATTETGSLIHD